MPTQSARQLALSATACLGLAFGAVSVAQAQNQPTEPVQTDSRTALQQYESTLQEISDRRVTLAQREFYLQQQNQQIGQLTAQVASATDADAREELMPILREMVSEMEKRMVADLPFRVERRFALLDDLRDDMQGDNFSVFDGFRRALDIYGLEVGYGLQVGAYSGQNPVEPGGRYAACVENVDSEVCDLSQEQRTALNNGALIEDLREEIYDGNYIHYGRMALLYLERDSSEGYRYNQDTEEWDPVSNSELLGLRQNVRIARGESAISTMTAPIRIGEPGADAS